MAAFITDHWVYDIPDELKAKPEITVKDANETLQKAMQDDPHYAWGWQSNIAMAILDSGVDVTPRDANITAAAVMKRCFDVDVTDSWEYRVATEIKPDEQ